MESFYKFILMLMFLPLLACSSYTETKAPCDYYASFCGTKIAINE